MTSPKQARQLARGWSDEVLECRTLSHNWQPYRAVQNKRYKFYYIEHICARCKTVRWQEINFNGQVYAHGYRYAEGYLTAPGTGRLTGEARDILRLETVTRTFTVKADDTQQSASRKGRKK